MKIKLITFATFFIVLLFIHAGNDISPHEKEEIDRSYAALQSENITEFLDAGHGNESALKNHLIDYLCMKAAHRFRNAISQKFGNNAWEKYKSISLKNFSPSYDFSDPVKSYTKLNDGKIKVTTQNHHEFIFDLDNGTYCLDINKLLKNNFNPSFALQIKGSFDYGTRIASAPHFNGSIKSLKKAMSNQFLHLTDSLKLSYQFPKEGLSYFVTMHLKKDFPRDKSFIQIVSNYFIKITPTAEKSWLNLSVICITDETNPKSNITNFSIKIQVDPSGNILKMSGMEELNKQQKLNLSLSLPLCLLSVPTKSLLLNDMWVTQQQPYAKNYPEKEWSRENIHKLDYWYENENKDVITQISNCYSSADKALRTGTKNFIFNAKKGYIIKSIDFGTTISNQNTPNFSITNYCVESELVSNDIFDSLQRYNMANKNSADTSDRK